MITFSRFRRMFRGAALLGLACLSLQNAQAQIEPEASALLKKATDFLAKQQKFSLNTRSSLEIVLDSGQKIQFDHTTAQSVQRPDKLRVERGGDLVKQLFIYDGKSLILSSPSQHVYARVPAPDTLEAMLDFARSSLDIIAPAGDLIYKDAYDILMTDVESGFVVGKGVVEGARCDHLAFRAPNVDWQIWIEDGQRPLIRKLILTTRDLASAPQFSVVVSRWDLMPAFTADTFRISPPKGAQKIDFVAPR
ncbi:DUF2092 domain-containing protein [Uliginosibacterium aquaticum]|uniref:DUF2092 domain-containing protein n=1 Tax=Uliginosibacterium aquaticum TaxID=2731212 RepID=A0ABX2IKL5_9RHOO|nr:DUF2092 domain-containing protein [Uliginosibacterium aquaticum]NSL55209.1 DUF2092 domain-containing protein [Uliginosibacterium aquaticum]